MLNGSVWIVTYGFTVEGNLAANVYRSPSAFMRQLYKSVQLLSKKTGKHEFCSPKNVKKMRVTDVFYQVTSQITFTTLEEYENEGFNLYQYPGTVLFNLTRCRVVD